MGFPVGAVSISFRAFRRSSGTEGIAPRLFGVIRRSLCFGLGPAKTEPPPTKKQSISHWTPIRTNTNLPLIPITTKVGVFHSVA